MDNFYHGVIERPEDHFGEDVQSWQEWAMKPYAVRCEVCSAEDSGSERDLRARGWVLDRSGEWCWRHQV